ncbi:unnamed protein product [marine sediment metagenome]|uniref:Uncharacterized protein n=1 Tax=marine sediment metagenome TaxID=412755 RepID=X1M825_9ZZZZ
MGAITDKLNAEWAEKQVDENMFTVRAIIEDFYNDLSEAISRGSDLYPTGDADFDTYVGPIVQEMTTFKNQLENNYAEFINWRQ